jgi:predicted transcriptional regulator
MSKNIAVESEHKRRSRDVMIFVDILSERLRVIRSPQL